MPIHSEPHSTSSFRKGLFPKVLISFLLIASLGGFSGYLTMTGEGSWYQEINKPVFTPPNWVFGPAWMLLYLLLGISFGRIWHISVRSRYPIVKRYAILGLKIFGLHFLLQLAWTPVFFGLEAPGWGLVIIISLLGLIIYLIKHFFRLDRFAGFALIPYFAWVTFATILNIAIFFMN
jgi:benzodiazapine receptor